MVTVSETIKQRRYKADFKIRKSTMMGKMLIEQ